MLTSVNSARARWKSGQIGICICVKRAISRAPGPKSIDAVGWFIVGSFLSAFVCAAYRPAPATATLTK